MANMTWGERWALVRRAVAGTTVGTSALQPESRGGQLLTGVLQSGGDPPPRSSQHFLEAYSGMPWFRAALSRVSYDVAATEWQVLVERRNGRAVRNRLLQRAGSPQRKALIRQMKQSGELEPLDTHPVLDLIDTANPLQTGLAVRRTTQIHLDAVGESFWLLERGALDVPVCLWPIPPHWVESTPSPSRPFYRVQFRGWKGDIPESEIIPFQDMDPLNPYGRGVGTGPALADELETDEYAARMTKAFFFNRARPDLLIWPKGDQPLQESEVRRLEEQWSRQNQGFWRAFRPFFMKRELEVKELETNFRSMQFTELRSFERDTILQVFGVSPEVMGILKSGSARATITMADQIYAKRVQVPRLEFLRLVMQERLLPLFDDRLVLDYVSPDVQDEELQLEAAKAAPWALTADEWRERMGHGPLDQDRGHLHLVPSGLRPVEDLSEPPPAPPPPVMSPPMAPSDQDVEIGDGDVDGQDEAMSSGSVRKAVRSSLGWSRPLREAQACEQVGDYETAWHFRMFASHELEADDTPAATRLAERQALAYRNDQEQAWHRVSEQADREALERAVAARDPDAVLDAYGGAVALGEALSGPFQAHGRQVYLRGAELALRTLPGRSEREPMPLDMSDMNPEVARWAQVHAAELVQGLTDAQRETVRLVIVDAVTRGVHPRAVVSRLVSEGLIGLLPKQMDAVIRTAERLRAEGVADAVVERRVARYAQAQLRYRAWTIARTEVLTAVNAGQDALWQLAKQRKLLPPDTKRVWIATLDELLEPRCEALNDEQRGLDEAFSAGVMRPPLHPRCRCTIGLVSIPPVTVAASFANAIEPLTATLRELATSPKVRTVEHDEHGRIVRMRESSEL